MKTNEKIKVGFVSLGCDKNRVDTEKIVSNLAEYDFEFVSDEKNADVIVINTCAFLRSAREEAKQTILEMAALKNHNLKKLVVVGCLPLLQKDNLKKEMDVIDEVVLPENYSKIAEIVYGLFKKELPTTKKEVAARMLTTPRHFAYLKIADGCNNCCSFCKIPSIRGNYKSVEIEELLREATALCEKGVKEIVLVAQDITRYGVDLYKKPRLKELLQGLLKIKKLSWIRLLYCYPEGLDEEIIEEIKDNPKVVKYIDIPLQHISDNVLKLMGRRGDFEKISRLLGDLRRQIPEIKIRTTFMVGFPGETRADFTNLCKFLKTQKLDNVGFFKYSREEGTVSYDLPLQIDENTKEKRLKKVQKIQYKIARKKLGAIKGTFKIICDAYDEKHNLYRGRTYFFAPEIDFEVLFSSYKKISVGSFVDVEIVKFKKGFLIGEVK